MRILIVTSTFELGGAENHAFKLAKYFKNIKKIDVEFWVFSEGDSTTKNMCKEQGIPTKVLTDFLKFQKFPFSIIQIIHYAKRVKTYDPDCIISFNLKPNIWNGVISKFSGVKCSIWSQQSELNYAFKGSLEKFSLKNISCFISNAQHASDKLLKTIPVKRDAKDFYVIHNGIEEQIPKQPKQYWEDILELNSYNYVVTMVANITHTKDHETLIRAWEIVVNNLKDKDINPLLILAGRKGNTFEKVNKLIQELNLSHNVKAIGATDDIAGLNTCSNLGVLSSNAEGLPNSVMEQMAIGLPIVGTANDGTIEAVGDEMIVYLSPKSDHTNLANKIITFALNPLLGKEVGAKNKLRVQEVFSISKMGESTFDIINKRME